MYVVFLRVRLPLFAYEPSISGRIPKLLLLSPVGAGTEVKDGRGPGVPLFLWILPYWLGFFILSISLLFS